MAHKTRQLSSLHRKIKMIKNFPEFHAISRNSLLRNDDESQGLTGMP